MGLSLALFVLPVFSLGSTSADYSIDTYAEHQSVSSLQSDAPPEVTQLETQAGVEDSSEVVLSYIAPEIEESLHQDVEAARQSVIVPFYSQFTDISRPEWRKVGCGIASLAMVIDYYTDDVSVDTLLEAGIARNAYLDNAGWIHAGLINLANDHGLSGTSVALAGMSKAAAFTKLEEVLAEGPVMVSVHYTFEPTNPIPHLVVVNEVRDGLVYYNDPAEASGGGSLTIQKFLSAWKQRYIEIRPNV